MSTREPRAPESALEPAGGAPDPWWRRLHARNRALPPAQAGTMRGAVWTVFVAVEFYLFSNPLVFIPWFEWSLNTALEIALLFLLVQVPWLRLRPPPPTVLLFVAFITLSVAWSQLPEVTWINIRIYVAVAVVAWLISVNVSPRVMAYGLLLGGVLVVVLSLYAVHENLPGAAVADGGSGYMAGVGTNRNILAYVLATVCAAVAMPPRRPLGWLVWAPSVGVVLIGLSLAGSATGGIAAAAAFVTVAVLVGDEWARRHRSRAGRRGLWMASLAVLGLVAWRTNDIAAVLGRETSTFSGRLPIWEAAWQATQPQLWQGFGWGAVWPHPWVPAPPNRVMDVIWFATDDPYYYPPHGHSSLFDLLPQVGLIGVVLAALIHIEALARAVSARRAVPADPEDVAAGRMVILLLVVLLVFGLSEPLTTIPFGWFLLIMACGVLPLRRPEHRPRPRRRLDSGRRRLVVPAMGRWVR